MAQRQGRWMPAIVLSTVMATGVFALAAQSAGESPATAQPSQQQLLDEVRALRAEVDALKASRATQTPAPSTATPASPAESDIAATAAAVQKDAGNRPFSFAAISAITGFDGKGFVLSDESGNNVFRPGFILQARNITNWREHAKNFGHHDDTENGWEIRRAKVIMTGNLITPDLTYRFQMANQVNGSSFVLDDAWAQYHFYTGDLGKLSFKVGQFKPPVIHEEYEIGDEGQMAPERSLLNDTIGGTSMGPRSQGISFIWNSPSDILHGEAMIHDGSGNSVGGGGTFTTGGVTKILPGNVVGSANTDFRDLKGTGTPIWGAAGRIEWKAFGDWGDYSDFTARASKKDLLVFGAGVDETEATGGGYYTHFSADVQVKCPCGLSVFVEGIGDFTDFRHVAGFNNNFDYGALVQVAFAINHKIEPFIRVDAIKFDDDTVPSNNLVSEIGLGMNYYLGEGGNYGHHAKVTFQAVYLPIGPGPIDHLNADELANSFNNEILLQAQFQLAL